MYWDARPSRCRIDESCMCRLNWAMSCSVVHDGIVEAANIIAVRVEYFTWPVPRVDPSIFHVIVGLVALVIWLRSRSNCSHALLATKMHVVTDQCGKLTSFCLTLLDMVSQRVRTSGLRSKMSAVKLSNVLMMIRHNSGSLLV